MSSSKYRPLAVPVNQSLPCPPVARLFSNCFQSYQLILVIVTCRTAVTGGASPRRSNLVGTFGLLESISGVRARDASFWMKLGWQSFEPCDIMWVSSDLWLMRLSCSFTCFCLSFKVTCPSPLELGIARCSFSIGHHMTQWSHSSTDGRSPLWFRNIDQIWRG